MLDMHEEVQEALGRTYGMPEVDDDELQAELDALGDEIALDDDTSYLDEVKAPAAPSKEPGADSIRNKVSLAQWGISTFQLGQLEPYLKIDNSRSQTALKLVKAC